MKPLRQKMINDMRLRRFSESTQEAYVPAVADMAKHYNKSPDLIDNASIAVSIIFL